MIPLQKKHVLFWDYKGCLGNLAPHTSEVGLLARGLGAMGERTWGPGLACFKGPLSSW